MAVEIEQHNYTLADSIGAGFAVFNEGTPELIEFLLHVMHEETDVSDEAADALVSLIVSEPIPMPPDVNNMGPASSDALYEELEFRGMYVESAIERLMGREEPLGTLMQSENIFFAAHLRVAERRVSSAVTVDTLAPTHNGVLSWYATKIDRSTLQECKDSHLKNFRTDKKPLVGWPGAVIIQETGRHASGCRCEARDPIEGAEFLA